MQLTQGQRDIFLTISIMNMLVKLDFNLDATEELVDMFASIATLRLHVDMD
jgi:hypothetical protein